MTKQDAIKIFEDRKVRTVWDNETEEWYFSIVDVIGILTDSPNPRNHWKVLKHRLIKEGNESVTNCNQLKMPAPEWTYRSSPPRRHHCPQCPPGIGGEDREKGRYSSQCQRRAEIGRGREITHPVHRKERAFRSFFPTEVQEGMRLMRSRV